MKKLIPFITLALLSAHSFAQTNYPGGISGCIARWDFSSIGTFSSLPDVSGNSNSGAVTNINASTGWQGNVNSAGVFNGTSSRARVPNSSLLSPSAITIIAIIKPTGFYTGLCQENNIIYKSVSYFQTGCWGMRIGDFDGDCSNVSTMQELDFAGPALPSGSVSPSPFISVNKWYFLATTYDGNVVKRYTVPMNTGLHLTGISYNDTYTIGAALTANSEDVFIGATQNPSYPFWFNGSMDELALFNRVLSDAEIQSVYDYLWYQAGNITINQPFTDTVQHPGATLNLNYTVHGTNAFSTGNVFIAQLSDATGSFATPVSIGTKIDTGSGVITCTIPAATPLGNHYRVRIISTTPGYTSNDDGKDIIILATGISSITSSASSFTIYPNPGKGSFILTGATNDNQPLDVVITNSIGQVVYKTNVTPVNNNIHLPIDMNCASGLYTAHIRNESHNQTIKFTINR